MGMQYGRQAEGSRTNVYIVSFVINWRCWIFYWRRSHWLWFWKRSRAMERSESRWRRPSPPCFPTIWPIRIVFPKKKGLQVKICGQVCDETGILGNFTSFYDEFEFFQNSKDPSTLLKGYQLSLRIRLRLELSCLSHELSRVSCVTRNPCS